MKFFLSYAELLIGSMLIGAWGESIFLGFGVAFLGQFYMGVNELPEP